MYRLKKFEIRASEIADYLNQSLQGEDFVINDPHFIRTPKSSIRLAECCNLEGNQVLMISDEPVSSNLCAGYILSPNPDLDLAYVLREFYATSSPNQIHPSAVVSEEARIGRNVMVGAHAIIGPDVELGDNTRIFHNVILTGPIHIGKYCVIKDGAVIGSEGWGFINDEEGIPVHAPQLGDILIEDRVWIGSNTTIERGMIEDTIIRNDVKIDDLVHIGAGSLIGQKTKITAGVVVASHVLIGSNVHIAPGAVIREDLKIGDDVIIGMGAVVIEDLSPGCSYVGNPARLLRKG